VTHRPPNPLAAIAAVTTLVVAAAIAAVALLAGGCEGRPAFLPPSASPGSTTSTASPTSVPAGTRATAGPALEWRLLVVVGAPSRPRARILDTALPGSAGLPLDLPAPVAGDRLATVVAAPDGRLAAVTQGGRAWIAPARSAGDGEEWAPLPINLDDPLPGPVLGATWSDDAARLVLVAGAPGSGMRRTAIISVPLDGTRATMVQVPLEADGPAIAALPGGRVAFVGRDVQDRGSLALVAAGGSFVSRPVAARSVATGGDVVALADDGAVRVGTLADLDRGALPDERLPLEGGAGIGAVALAPDGSAVAVVRLDGGGAAARIDVLRRAGNGWQAVGSIGLDPTDGTAIPAWLP